MVRRDGSRVRRCARATTETILASRIVRISRQRSDIAQTCRLGKRVTSIRPSACSSLKQRRSIRFVEHLTGDRPCSGTSAHGP